MASQYHPVDIHVGGRVKMRRGILGLSQTDLARQLGVTFQQVQKYEKGLNRIGSSRLFEIAQALEVPVSYFFEGLEPSLTPTSQTGKDIEALMKSPNGVALCRAFAKVKDAKMQTRLLKLVESISETSEDA